MARNFHYGAVERGEHAKYARTLDTPLEDATCISKSEMSHRFSVAMEARMEEFFGRRWNMPDQGLQMLLGLAASSPYSTTVGTSSSGGRKFLSKSAPVSRNVFFFQLGLVIHPGRGTASGYLTCAF